MMSDEYPTFESLGIDPDYLWIGASAMYALNGTRPPAQRVMSAPPDKETARARNVCHSRAHGVGPRLYKSRFVGVTVNKGCWVGLMDVRGTKHGPRRDRTDAGEVQAAWDRAIALGRPGLEERPAEHVAPRDEVRAVHEPRGAFKKPLGGKRIV
jgi:hypothetical protein